MPKTVKSSDIQGNEHEVPVDELTWRPAAYAMVIHEGKILLTRQHNVLHLPGGGIELGEKPEDGVVREVREETGLTVGNPRLIDVTSDFFTFRQPNEHNRALTHVHSILLYYQCDLSGGELSIGGFDEDEKLVGEMPEWVSIERLDDIAAGNIIDWRNVVRKVLASRLKDSTPPILGS